MNKPEKPNLFKILERASITFAIIGIITLILSFIL
jgi:hypothetical protein